MTTTTDTSALVGVDQGAARLYVASGGTLEGESGSTVTLASATVTALSAPTISATNIDAGASGTAGTVDIFPTTASKGKIAITATSNTNNDTLTITNAAQAAARTYTIPDAGASASFVMTAGAQSIAGDKTFTGSLRAPEMFLPASADAAISIVAYSQSIYITKAGVCALTLADPTATTHDGARLTIIATTAHAHTVSNAAGSGFNGGGGASDVATFGGAIGDSMIIEAYQGKWLVVSLRNVTLG